MAIAAWKREADTSDAKRSKLLESAADELEHHLDWQARFEALTSKLQPWLDHHQHAAGDTIVGGESAGGDLQLLLAGRASAYDAEGTRLYQCGPGDAIGPGSAQSEDTAYVAADDDCTTMALSPAALERLEEKQARLALQLYRYLLAGRIDHGPSGRGLT